VLTDIKADLRGTSAVARLSRCSARFCRSESDELPPEIGSLWLQMRTDPAGEAGRRRRGLRWIRRLKRASWGRSGT
jgi:hypothetical protein